MIRRSIYVLLMKRKGEIPLADCLFCKIIQGEIPSKAVYEDAHTYAFLDINPQAPTHVLVVSKAHVANIVEASALEDDALAACLRTAAKVALLEGLEAGGFRVVTNCGEHAGQTVSHLHLHVLGGKPMNTTMA